MNNSPSNKWKIKSGVMLHNMATGGFRSIVKRHEGGMMASSCRGDSSTDASAASPAEVGGEGERGKGCHKLPLLPKIVCIRQFMNPREMCKLIHDDACS